MSRMKTASREVYLAVREVRPRFMGTRVGPKFEAELRELVKDRYERRVRITRAQKALVIEAAQALAKRRGWSISPKRIGWTTFDAAYERAIAEDVRDMTAVLPVVVGEAVITGLHVTDERLVLPTAVHGRVSIVDQHGQVFVEFTKDASTTPLTIGLPNGTYAVYADKPVLEAAPKAALLRVDPARVEAAVEVLQAVFLHEKRFDLESTIVQHAGLPVADEDADGYLWITVRLHVPRLDIDTWIDGTHLDHPDNQDED